MSARESWGHEMESVFLYRVVAEAEPADDRRALFNKLAGEAEAQAAIGRRRSTRWANPPRTPTRRPHGPASSRRWCGGSARGA